MSCTFVSMSYNLYGDNRLTERVPALRSLFATRDPDLVSVQELRAESRSMIDQVLPGHQRVHDADAGWTAQSNIWWRDEIFALEEYGLESIGHDLDAEKDRGLFWVRLRVRDAPEAPALVYGTAHLTAQWKDRAEVNPRTGQIRRIIAELDRVASASPCIFTTDINDVERPVMALRDAGFTDSFSALGTISPVTHPVAALASPQSQQRSVPVISKVYDWQFFRGPLRSRCCEVPDIVYPGIAPSDHKPVVATFTI